MEGGIFQSLVTRWTVAPVSVGHPHAGSGSGVGVGKPSEEGKENVQKEWTEVTLSVTFQFANPALGFAVGQVADDKVDEMVAAFEERARKLYGRR
jgi:coenzyme Q-binding protein COQ10